METTTISSGDVYLFAADNRKGTLAAKLHAPGPFLECFAKSTYFDYWANQKPQAGDSISLEQMSSQISLGYFDIIQVSGEGKIQVSGTIGFFIPNDVNKRVIAENLRKRFGAGTILVKPGIMSPPDGNIIYLSWVKSKHSQQNPEFVRQLVSECATQFALLDTLDDDARAKIYEDVRRKTPNNDLERLRKNAHIHCNS